MTGNAIGAGSSVNHIGTVNVNLNSPAGIVRTVAETAQDPARMRAILGDHGLWGRQWLHDQLSEAWRRTTFVVLEAEAGWGKSAFAADLGERGAAVVHVRLMQDRADIGELLTALASASMLAAGEEPSFLVDAGWANPEGFRAAIIVAATQRQEKFGDRLLLVIDGADELALADLGPSGLSPVPLGADLLITCRTGRVPYAPALDALSLSPSKDDDLNLRDLADYVAARLGDPTFEAVLNAAALSSVEAATLIIEAAEGLFIHAEMVLREFKDGVRPNLRNLPRGLQAYYEDVLHRERERDLARWTAARLPVLGALAAAREPATSTQLAVVTGLSDLTVVDVLAEWSPVVAVVSSDGNEDRYSIYHGSLQRLADNDVETGARFGPATIALQEATRRAHSDWADHLMTSVGGLDEALPGLLKAVRDRQPDALHLLRHGYEHLTRSGHTRDLVRILTLPAAGRGEPGKGLWADAQAAAGSPARLLRDVRACEAAAQRKIDDDLERAPIGVGVGCSAWCR